MTLEKIWTIKPVDDRIVLDIKRALNTNISLSLCKLLAQRGITNFEEAKKFFRPQIADLHDPFLMKDMQKVIDRIQKAADNHEKIMIYGDYDVDGTTSVAIVYNYLKRNLPNYKEGQITYYIPHRYKEGYGMSQIGIEKCISENISLIITLDCGIKNDIEVDLANQHNIDVIICDHHFPGDILPKAHAILNPKQADCTYPFKELSGCGIGYKLISGLAHHWQSDYDAEVAIYLDLVVTSIAADFVPIVDENRILAHYGLLKVADNPSISIKSLKEKVGIYKKLSISDLIFVIAPRINAAGRMDDANKAVQFFIEENPEKVAEIALSLQANNDERKIIDESISDEAVRMLEADPDLESNPSIVIFQKHWHKGVVGIVASRIIEHYHKPTIVLTQSNDRISGSARSVIGFNIHEAIGACSELLENYGGHYFAAGLTMVPENLEQFKTKFQQVVRDSISKNSMQPQINVDAEITLDAITPSFMNILKQFEPFGPENPLPIFISRNVYNRGCKIVKNKHIRFSVGQQKTGHTITGIGFNLQHLFNPIIKSNEMFDICYHIEENEWNNNKHIQIRVIDIRPSTKS